MVCRDRMIISNYLQEQFDKRKQEYEISLHDRRQQLADLYNTEIEQWRTEVLNNVETLEDRQARCPYFRNNQQHMFHAFVTLESWNELTR